MRTFASLSKALFKGFVRDKVSVFFTIVFPLMFLVIFGALFSDPGSSSSTIIQVGEVTALDEMEQGAPEEYEKLFDVTKSDDTEAAIEKVRQGDADAVVRQEGEEVYLYFSAADQTKAAIVQASITGVVDAANLHRLTAEAPDVEVDTVAPEVVEDESLTAIQYLTPGLLGWAISISGVFGAAATLVDWRKNKILRRLRLAPVPIPAVIGARVGVSMTTSIVQLGIFIAVASLPFFGLRLSGYWWMAIPVLLVGTLAFLSIGMVVGAIAKTSEGASGLGNLIVMPMAFASGSFFPLDQSPVWLQTISKISPLTYINEALLSVMVRGNGPGSVVVPIAVLLAFTIVFAALAWKLFKWDDL